MILYTSRYDARRRISMPLCIQSLHTLSKSRSQFLRTICSFISSHWRREAFVDEEHCFHLIQSLSQSSRLGHCKALHAKILKLSLILSTFISNHLLNIYAKCGDLDCSLQVFDEMYQRNVVSWSALISGLVQHGSSEQAIRVFLQMHSEGVKPNEFTFVSLLQSCSFSGNLNLSYQIYALIIRMGFHQNIFLINAMLNAVFRGKRFVEALQLFESSLGRDVVSWNTMLAGYLQFSVDEIPCFWQRMHWEGVKPDHFTFASVLTGFAALSSITMGSQTHAHLVKHGHGDEICVGNSLVDMYLKNGLVEEAFRAFAQVPCKDVVSWTQMAAGCLNCGEPEKALEMVAEMKRMGVNVNKFTLATAINACASLAALEEGKKNHVLRIKLGDTMDVCVDNALLDMYSKCGSMDAAFLVFLSMNGRTVISWTTMVMGYAQNGSPRSALKMFDEMIINGVEPNYIAFICVLYACSQGGFIDEGWKYFKSMNDYGIQPGEDHYACMVGLLGRAGCIREAEELIQGNPFQPSALLWQILLGCCQDRGLVETGMRAAERALAMDGRDPSTYVLLSNMYAGFGIWDRVGSLREVMEAWSVRKLPGSSWIKPCTKNNL